MSTQCIYSLSKFFIQVGTQKCWTAWRIVERKNKVGEVKITKVPYSRVSVEARSNDPTTWIDIEEAQAIAETKEFIKSGGGIGIFLGIDFGSEYRLGGVDLDTCLAPGGLVPWAKDVIERFGTYGEISPSDTGIKLYFLYRIADLDEIRRITGSNWSRNFKEDSGSDHAPGIELHIGHRYFAMTGDLYHSCPEALRVTEVEDIAWLINEIGPQITGHGLAREQDDYIASVRSLRSTSNGHDAPRAYGGSDQSRSGRAASRLLSLWGNGVVTTYEQGKDALLNDDDPGIVEWMHDKGLARREREFSRLWDFVSSREKSFAGSSFVDQQYTDFLQAMQEEATEIDEPIVEATVEPKPEPETPTEAVEPAKGQTAEHSLFDPWDSLTTPPKLIPEMVPLGLHYGFDVAKRHGTNVEMIIGMMLAACAGAASDAITLQPTNDVHWQEPPRLWIMNIGESGVGKTPAQKEANAPLKLVEEMWLQEDLRKLAQYEMEMVQYDAAHKEWENRVKGGDQSLPPEEPTKPGFRQIIVNDMTMESLSQDILPVNPQGVFIVADELTELLGGLDAYKHGKKDRAALLDLWNGGPKVYNRRGSGRVYVPNNGASIVCGIQDAMLKQIAPTMDSDGLFQRFAPTRGFNVGSERNEDSTDEVAQTLYHQVIIELAKLTSCGEVCEPIRLSPEAKRYWREVDDLSRFMLRDEDRLPATLRQHANKIPAMCTRLMLVVHLIEFVTFPGERDFQIVAGSTAKMARDMMIEMFIPNAVDIYMKYFAHDAKVFDEAQRCAAFILRNPKLTVIKPRDIQRGVHLKDSRSILDAMNTLKGYQWMTEIEAGKAWKVNPEVHCRFAERAAWERSQAEEKKAKIERAAAIRRKTYKSRDTVGEVGEQCQSPRMRNQRLIIIQGLAAASPHRR